MHSYHDAANCAECPLPTGDGLSEKADCAKLAQFHALKEGSLTLFAPGGVAHVYAINTPARPLVFASDGERFSRIKAPGKIRRFSQASAPLRI
jgi:hypothetical protein